MFINRSQLSALHAASIPQRPDDGEHLFFCAQRYNASTMFRNYYFCNINKQHFLHNE